MNHKLILKSLKLLPLVLACFALIPVAQAQPEDRGNGFLDQLWAVYAKDAGRAVLYARWYWELLPEELAQQAAIVQLQAKAIQDKQKIDQQVANGLGLIGIFRSSEGGVPFSGSMNPDYAMFITIMNTIRMHRGDPPASPEEAQVAEAVLRGEADLANALLAATPAFNRQQVAMTIELLQMMGMNQLLRLLAVVNAASALPRERIPVLIPELQR